MFESYQQLDRRTFLATGLALLVVRPVCRVLGLKIPTWALTPEERYARYAIPLLRSVFPKLLANQLCSVQPMLGPVSQVFALGATYKSRGPRITEEEFYGIHRELDIAKQKDSIEIIKL